MVFNDWQRGWIFFFVKLFNVELFVVFQFLFFLFLEVVLEVVQNNLGEEVIEIVGEGLEFIIKEEIEENSYCDVNIEMQQIFI